MLFARSRTPAAAGAAFNRSATRGSTSSPNPSWKSTPSGPEISSRMSWPTVFPVTRRITSPTRKPERHRVVGEGGTRFPKRFLIPEEANHRVPIQESSGRLQFVQCGQSRKMREQVANGSLSLPAAANSGQYRATGASRSSSPRSMSRFATSAVIPLVADIT